MPIRASFAQARPCPAVTRGKKVRQAMQSAARCPCALRSRKYQDPVLQVETAVPARGRGLSSSGSRFNHGERERRQSVVATAVSVANIRKRKSANCERSMPEPRLPAQSCTLTVIGSRASQASDRPGLGAWGTIADSGMPSFSASLSAPASQGVAWFALQRRCRWHCRWPGRWGWTVVHRCL